MIDAAIHWEITKKRKEIKPRRIIEILGTTFVTHKLLYKLDSPSTHIHPKRYYQ